MWTRPFLTIWVNGVWQPDNNHSQEREKKTWTKCLERLQIWLDKECKQGCAAHPESGCQKNEEPALFTRDFPFLFSKASLFLTYFHASHAGMQDTHTPKNTNAAYGPNLKRVAWDLWRECTVEFKSTERTYLHTQVVRHFAFISRASWSATRRSSFSFKNTKALEYYTCIINTCKQILKTHNWKCTTNICSEYWNHVANLSTNPTGVSNYSTVQTSEQSFWSHLHQQWVSFCQQKF